jgi:hypothetical protein
MPSVIYEVEDATVVDDDEMAVGATTVKGLGRTAAVEDDVLTGAVDDEVAVRPFCK